VNELEGISVRPRPNEDPEKLIRRFVKKVRSEGILREAARRMSFEKPSARRRRKAAAARHARELADSTSV
jgi:small subunit ribosomal protein S21